jgi:hypothetical protein
MPRLPTVGVLPLILSLLKEPGIKGGAEERLVVVPPGWMEEARDSIDELVNQFNLDLSAAVAFYIIRVPKNILLRRQSVFRRCVLRNG